MILKFISLCSGSSGNCFYLGTSSYGILIDAGIGSRSIRKVLKERGIAIEQILAVFITHDHADHIKGVGGLSKRFSIPVYAPELTHRGIDRNYCMTEKIEQGNRRYCRKGETIEVRDFRITPFEVPHDANDNVGYSIELADKRFCIITDIGHVTPLAIEHIKKANYLVLEANYDEEMLRTGPYSPMLKERIVGSRGHLSNREAGECLAEHFPDGLRHVWLCHLSRENNHPELAYKTVEWALKQVGRNAGTDYKLETLKRTTPSEIYEL